MRKALDTINLNIAGVDVLYSDNGPMIIEINSALDFAIHNIEKICETDVAGAMIEYAVSGKEAYDKGEGVWLATANI